MQSQVIQGDCLPELIKLPAASIQTVFMDPPYNFAFDYGDGRKADSRPTAEYLADIELVVQRCVRLLTPTGSLWLLGPEREHSARHESAQVVPRTCSMNASDDSPDFVAADRETGITAERSARRLGNTFGNV